MRALLMASLALNLSAAEFEVASLKPNTSGSPGFSIVTLPGGGLRARNIHLKRLIAVAYAVTDFQILAPAVPWLESQRYDLDAKSAAPAELGEIRLMLRSMLEDRFKLKVHAEPKEMPIYSLIPAKTKSAAEGLVAAGEGDCAAATTPQAGLPNGTACGVVNINPAAGWIRGHRGRISQLCDRLSSLLGRTVVDKSGLSGLFDINLTWAPDTDPGATGASLFTSIQEQLGLKLEAGKGPVDMIVLDSAEKATAN